MELILDRVLEVIADVALAHGDTVSQRQGLTEIDDAVRGITLIQARLNVADLWAVTVADDDFVTIFNQASDWLGDDANTLDEIIELCTEGIAPQRN